MTEIHQQTGKFKVRQDHVRLKPNGALIRADCLVVLPDQPQRVPEIDPWFGMAGMNLDRPPDQIDRGLNVTALQFDDSQHMQRLGVVG